MTLVSILIPVYNGEKFIGRAIASALDQEYKNLEVVVSDNASTDRTREVVERYLSDRRLKYFRNEKNLGMMPNHKIALYERASGDIAMILPADDFIASPALIATAVGLFEAHSEIVMVFSNSRIVFEESNDYYDQNISLPEVLDGKTFFRKMLLRTRRFDRRSVLSPCSNTVIFRRNVAMAAGAYSHDIRGADWEALLLLCLEGAVGFIPAVYGGFVDRSDGNTRKLDRADQDEENTRFITDTAERAIARGWEPRMVRKVELRLLQNFYSGVLKNRLVHRESSIKNVFCFMHFLYSRDKRLISVMWQPTILLRVATMKVPALYRMLRKLLLVKRLRKVGISGMASRTHLP